MNKIRKGDSVLVIAGRDKGKRGEVSAVLDGAVLVSGVNQVKKHAKPNPMKNEPGGIVTKEMPLNISNVALWNSKSGQSDSVRIELRDGKRVRVFKTTGDLVGA